MPVPGGRGFDREEEDEEDREERMREEVENALEGSPIVEHTAEATCPKCGYEEGDDATKKTALEWKYCVEPKIDEGSLCKVLIDQLDMSVDHLHLKCTRCAYEFLMLCSDFNLETVGRRQARKKKARFEKEASSEPSPLSGI